MDNLFEILIYVIIIISFLSSLFKKKQQPQKKPPIQQPHQEDYYQNDQPEVSVPRPQQKEEYDIMRELEDFFKVGTEQTSRDAPIPQQQTESLPSVEEHTKSEDWKKTTESEHYVDQWERKKTEVKKIITSVDASIEKKAALFEESLERKENNYDDLVFSLRSKFRNPSTLKEYIIFSEIIGKPKSLRR